MIALPIFILFGAIFGFFHHCAYKGYKHPQEPFSILNVPLWIILLFIAADIVALYTMYQLFIWNYHNSDV